MGKAEGESDCIVRPKQTLLRKITSKFSSSKHSENSQEAKKEIPIAVEVTLNVFYDSRRNDNRGPEEQKEIYSDLRELTKGSRPVFKQATLQCQTTCTLLTDVLSDEDIETTLEELINKKELLPDEYMLALNCSKKIDDRKYFREAFNDTSHLISITDQEPEKTDYKPEKTDQEKLADFRSIPVAEHVIGIDDNEYTFSDLKKNRDLDVAVYKQPEIGKTYHINPYDLHDEIVSWFPGITFGEWDPENTELRNDIYHFCLDTEVDTIPVKVTGFALHAKDCFNENLDKDFFPYMLDENGDSIVDDQFSVHLYHEEIGEIPSMSVSVLGLENLKDTINIKGIKKV
jgi:hypothetical protein